MANYSKKRRINEQDKVTSRFVGYRLGTGYNRHSAGGGLMIGIILCSTDAVSLNNSPRIDDAHKKNRMRVGYC